jgi:peptidoglycan/LPS O-acetylase OafA/YrhL
MRTAILPFSSTMDATGHGTNNFDVARFVAASAVLYSHCFALTAHGGDEPLVIATRGEFTFGGLAVRVFFVISGYLVTQSWLRNPRPAAFVAARVLRIFPALAVALAYCVLLGTIVTELPKFAFLTHADTWRFYWHNLLLQTEFFLPGVFRELPEKAVNGSLWSLYYEVRAYLVVLAIGCVGLMRKRLLATMAWLGAAVLIVADGALWGIRTPDDWPVINAFACFVGAALLALYPQAARSRWLALPATIAAAAQPFALGTPFSNWIMDLLLVTGTIAFAHWPLPRLARFGRYGDFSYGIFIYAYPTQQLIAWLGVSEAPYRMLALAYPLTLALAVLSWHCVERPCRDLKRFFRQRARAIESVPTSGGGQPNRVTAAQAPGR